jgi:hypothetical protein
MKKKIALISVLGAAGGLIYALESQHRRRTAKSENGTDKQSSLSEDGSDHKSFHAKTENDQSERAASMARIENGRPVIGEESDHVIDDHGTHQAEASELLRSIRDQAFESSDEKLALALGRPTEEISEWTGGSASVDGDVLMKARTLAMQRGFEI